MNFKHLHPFNQQQFTQMEEEIKKALKVLHEGGTILYPTDTIWGIGCDATNEAAVNKVYEIKRRVDSKKMIILLDNPYRLSLYVQKLHEIALDYHQQQNRPVTVVYSGAINLPKNVISDDGSIAVRIVSDPFCIKLISLFKKPIISTSANYAGQNPPRFFNDIDYNLLRSVDYVVDWRQNDTAPAAPSKIIKVLNNGEIELIRD
jgi:L-threonylcarbamoyladenylate synthase